MDEPFDFEGETDMELLGGTPDETPATDDLKTDSPATEPESPSDTVAEADDKEETPATETKEDDPPVRRDAVIPRARFDEVNAKLHAEREEAARLRAELEALTKKPEQAQSSASSFDMNEREEAYFDAILEGDKDKAREIRAEINAQIYEQARLASEQVAMSAISQRETQTSFNRAVAQTVEAYPFLDSTKPEANEAAIAEVIEWRDFYIARGESPAVALQRAAGKIAPMYIKTETPAPAVDQRKQAALATAAKVTAAQPPAMEAGVGNRSIPTGDDLLSDQNMWDKASDAERMRMLA